MSHDLPPQENAEQYCNRILAAMQKKADHNKTESLNAFLLTIVSSLAAPLFVTLGDTTFVGKVVPSILSLAAAGSTAWLQLRKPQQLWSLYRSAQRELEHAQVQYRFKLGDFENAENPEKILADKGSQIALHVHHKWTALVPNPEGIGGDQGTKKKR